MTKYFNEGSKEFAEVLKKLENSKVDNVQAMIKLSFDKLDELKKYYSDWADSAEELGYKESAAINKEKWLQITEAIEVKKGNEEQAWDYLT